MTCKEKLKQEHPELVDEEKYAPYGCKGCPSDYGYLEDPDDGTCVMTNCSACWNREIPVKSVENVWNPMPRELLAESKPTIKDSGDRTEFSTGAVRDMREGKGRCDLMPLEVVANYLCEDDSKTDWVLWSIREFQKTRSAHYLYSALLSFNEKHWNNHHTMFLEVAKHFEEGAKKYGENNWQKGIPVHCYIDSAVRHYLKWLRGDKDEPHDRAFVWNLMCCIWEVDHHKTTVEEVKT